MNTGYLLPKEIPMVGTCVVFVVIWFVFCHVWCIWLICCCVWLVCWQGKSCIEGWFPTPWTR